MPNRHSLQMTFEAGEVSPLLFSRSDLEGYRKAATYMENMIPNSRGNAYSRKGFEYKQDAGDATDTFGKLFAFRRDQNTTYIVAVTPTYIWIADQDAIIQSDDLMTNGTFDSGSTGWTTVTANGGSVTFSLGYANLVSASQINSSAKIKQTVTGLTAANLHIISIVASGASGGGPGALGSPGRIKVGTTDGGSDLVNATNWDGNDISFQFTPGATTIYIELECVSLQYEWPPDEGFGYYGYTIPVDTVTLVNNVTASGTPVTFTSPYTADQIPDVQAEMAPDLLEMVFVHRDVAPRELSLDTSVSPQTWAFTTITFTPADPFGSGEEPGAITWHQGRLVLASTASKPATLFMSKPGRANYYDFTYGTGANADDAIEVTLAKNCDIQWIEGSEVLYVGADNSEHIIRSDGPVLTPSDIEAAQQSSFGSFRVSNDWISENIAFISNDQRRIRMIDYDSDSRGSRTPDLTWAAEHITSGLIKEVHHAPNPENLLYVTLDDGNFLTCTYNTEVGALGWARHSIDGGIVLSMAVAEESGISIVYALVLSNGDLKLLRLTTANVFMDEFILRGYGTATTSIDELDHLEGETVQVIADGTQRDDETVSSGAITISGAAATQVYVGLSMPRIVDTMIIDSPGFYGGSTASFKKRWSEIVLRLCKCMIPKINGKRDTNLVPSDVSADIVGDGTPFDHRVHNLGWNTTGINRIEQDLPFDLNIVGVFGRLSEERIT